MFLTNSSSINSCNFGVLVGGGMLRVFLLYHPGDQEIIYVRISQPWASLIAQLVKNLPAVQKTLV